MEVYVVHVPLFEDERISVDCVFGGNIFIPHEQESRRKVGKMQILRFEKGQKIFDPLARQFFKFHNHSEFQFFP